MATHPRSSWILEARRMLQRFSRNTTCAVAVMAALAFPVLVGGMALGAEASFWYLSQRKLQQASDLAAYAAALELRSGRDETDMETAARNIASANGSSADDIDLESPPIEGSRAGVAPAVEVVVTRQQTRYFTLLYANDDVEISARSVVELRGGGDACLLALAPTGRAISVEGAADVVFQGCDVATNSNAPDAFYMQGAKVEFTAGCIHSVGGVSATSGLSMTACTTPETQAPVIRDPYADLVDPLIIGTCSSSTSLNGGKTGITVSPSQPHPLAFGGMSQCYSGGLDLKGKVRFKSGLHIINGGTFKVNAGADVSSEEGVTFFLTNGATIDFNGSATFKLSAPISGALSSILFYGDRDDVSGPEHTITGNAGSFLNGAIYLPSRALKYTGNYSGAGGCTQIVTRSVTFAGSSSVSVNCSAAGTRRILVGETIALVE